MPTAPVAARRSVPGPGADATSSAPPASSGALAHARRARCRRSAAAARSRAPSSAIRATTSPPVARERDAHAAARPRAGRRWTGPPARRGRRRSARRRRASSRSCALELEVACDAASGARSRRPACAARRRARGRRARRGAARAPAAAAPPSPAWRACWVSRSSSRSSGGACWRGRLEAQQHAGQRLVGLVVQVARDARALGLLRAQDGGGGARALGLEAVEHAVERRVQARDLVGARRSGSRGRRAGRRKSTAPSRRSARSSGSKRRRSTSPLTSTVASSAAASSIRTRWSLAERDLRRTSVAASTGRRSARR